VQFFKKSARVLPSLASKTFDACENKIYLIYTFGSLISNQAAINYLNGKKEGMSPELRKRLPSKEQ
jgi:hypothetical protein